MSENRKTDTTVLQGKSSKVNYYWSTCVLTYTQNSLVKCLVEDFKINTTAYSAVLRSSSINCFKPLLFMFKHGACLSCKFTDSQDKIICVSWAITRLFFSCQILRTHPAHSAPGTVFWKRVSWTSKLFPQHPYSTCVCLTEFGLNNRSGFNWMSSPYSPECKVGQELLFAGECDRLPGITGVTLRNL